MLLSVTMHAFVWDTPEAVVTVTQPGGTGEPPVPEGPSDTPIPGSAGPVVADAGGAAAGMGLGGLVRIEESRYPKPANTRSAPAMAGAAMTGSERGEGTEGRRRPWRGPPGWPTCRRAAPAALATRIPRATGAGNG